MAADCKSAAPCELRRFESSPVHQVEPFRSVNRLSIALSVYLVLGVLAWATLGDGRIRVVTFAILGLFVLKTLLHRKDEMHEDEKLK
jgi:hypothetical protein